MTLRLVCNSILTLSTALVLTGTAHAKAPHAYIVRSTVRQALQRDIAAIARRQSGVARLTADANVDRATRLLSEAQRHFDFGNKHIGLANLIKIDSIDTMVEKAQQKAGRIGAGTYAFMEGSAFSVQAGDLQLAAGDRAGAARSYKIAADTYELARVNYMTFNMPDLSMDAGAAKQRVLDKLTSVAGSAPKTLARR